MTRPAFRAALTGAAMALTLATSTFATSAAAQTELTFGSWFPAPHLAHEFGLEPYFERIAQDTGGSLTYKLFVGGVMGNAKASLANISSSVVDSSVIVDVYLKKELPAAITIGELIALADDPRVFAAASNETQLLDCPACEEERTGHNIKALSFHATGAYRLMCTEPVESLADVAGKKIRGASRVGALAQHLGGTPVGVTPSEQYEAMQRGQVDCTLGSTAWLDSYNLKDVVKTIVDYPLGAYFNAMTMNINLDTWNGLTKEQRDAMVKNLPGLVAGVVYAYIDEGDKAIAAAVDMLKLWEPSPPVPQLSIRGLHPSGMATWAAASRMACAPAFNSLAASPAQRHPARNAAIWASFNSPPNMAAKTLNVSSSSRFPSLKSLSRSLTGSAIDLSVGTFCRVSRRS